MKRLKFFVLAATITLALGSVASVCFAVIQPPGSSSNSTGLEGSISSPPPKDAPTITLPAAGQTFSSVPITVTGLCSSQTVKVFSNNVFVGAANCTNGSYQLQVDLFSGQNDLTAIQFDALGQQSPASGVVGVLFNSAQFAQFGTLLSLSSVYARRGANPGDTLTWPIILSGGQSPYAISVDWGDGSSPELVSQAGVGTFNIQHVYKTAGTYIVIVRATDANGVEAFLQLVGVANGSASTAPATTSSGSNQPTTVTVAKVIWWPFIVLIALIVVAFWLGRRQQLSSIRHQLEESRRE